ncbi:MAG: coiled-coil domain-containing protein [Alphaproteobacteria bacterium]
MASVAFDTLRFSQRLSEAGLGPAQAAGVAAATAEAIGELVGQLATRHDLALLRAEMHGEMASLRQELRGEMASLRGEMASLRHDLDGLRRETKAELAQLEMRMTIKLGTMMAGAVALAAALARML